jgi:hypothetical protein
MRRQLALWLCAESQLHPGASHTLKVFSVNAKQGDMPPQDPVTPMRLITGLPWRLLILTSKDSTSDSAIPGFP